jgi:hypothetical protein
MQLISLLRSSVFRTAVLVLMTAQLVNMSINVADPSLAIEDLSVNEIESCVELVLEVFLGKEGAIKETNDQDHSSHRTVNHVQFCVGDFTNVLVENNFIDVLKKHDTFLVLSFSSFEHVIIAPPPRT